MSETVGTDDRTESQRRQNRTAYLDPWREVARGWVGDAQKMTKEAIQTVISKTIAWLDDDEVPEDDRKAVKLHSIGLMAREQAPHLLPKITARPGADANQHELLLLNEVYSTDEGTKVRLGSMTPSQAESIVKAELFGQIKEIRDKWRSIEKIIKRCRHRNRPIIDQL